MNYRWTPGGVAAVETPVPLAWEGDVAVCGAGPAGLGAALASARRGMKTLLIEKNGFLGGMASFGSGMPLGGAYPGYKPIGGIAEEILRRVRKAGVNSADVRDVDPFGLWYFHDSDYFKHLAFQLAQESGVEVMLHTMTEDAVLQGETIKGVVCLSKEGRQAVAARAFVDATGDGDLAWKSGAPFEMGRDSDRALMAVTIPYVIFNADMPRVLEYEKADPGFAKALERARKDGREISREDKFTSWHEGMREGSFFSNIVRVRRVDATKNADILRGEREARKRMYQHLAFFRAYVPGFEGAYIGKAGEQIGIRDSRRIIGRTVLTYQDCLDQRKRPDGILRCAGPFDNTTRGEETTEAEGVEDPQDHYDIPYGCLVPQKVSNLLVAGRCFSADYLAQSGSRGMGLLFGMGQAAGTAASFLCREETTAAEVDVDRLRQALRDAGMAL